MIVTPQIQEISRSQKDSNYINDYVTFATHFGFSCPQLGFLFEQSDLVLYNNTS